MSNRTEAKQSRVIGSFLVSLSVIVAFFGITLFYSLPSNVLSARDNGPVRQAVGILAAQQFGYFTRNQKGEQLTVYRLSPNRQGIEDLLATPQNRPANLFGLSRTQRAQGPELSDLINLNRLAWFNCSGSATRCVVTNSELKPVHVANAAMYRTVCGDVFVVVETVVDWNYRNLVGYPRQALRVSHLDVSCS